MGQMAAFIPTHPKTTTTNESIFLLMHVHEMINLRCFKCGRQHTHTVRNQCKTGFGFIDRTKSDWVLLLDTTTTLCWCCVRASILQHFAGGIRYHNRSTFVKCQDGRRVLDNITTSATDLSGPTCFGCRLRKHSNTIELFSTSQLNCSIN